MALRNHEQYQHGVSEQVTAPSTIVHQLPAPPALEHRPNSVTMMGAHLPPLGRPVTPQEKYPNGVLVEPIRTDAMRLAIETKQTPFALLRPLNGIPVLVRVLAAGDKQVSGKLFSLKLCISPEKSIVDTIPRLSYNYAIKNITIF